MKHKIYIDNQGREKPYNPGLWENRYIQYYGKDITIEINKYSKSRTLEQNKKYWMYLKIISEFTGETKEYYHLLLGGSFIGVREIKYKDICYQVPVSTTTLNTKEFTEYLSQIRLWAFQEYQIILESEQL